MDQLLEDCRCPLAQSETAVLTLWQRGTACSWPELLQDRLVGQHQKEAACVGFHDMGVQVFPGRQGTVMVGTAMGLSIHSHHGGATTG